ncbi:MAG: efflux RND transporter periplasmic adaptor subunit [Thalassobaculales bacterium]
MRSFAAFIVVSLLAAAVGGGYWWSYLRPRPAPAAAAGGGGGFAMPVEAADAIRGTAVRKVKALGTLTAFNSITVRPEIAGRVERILFEDGTQVARNTPLVQIDQAILKAELDQAQAALRLSQQQFERANDLVARGAGTARARDEAVAALRNDEARVRLAQATLEKSVIRAPFEGIVGIRKISLGDYVAVGQDLVNLEQVQPIKVDFTLPERFLPQVKTGARVIFRSEAFPDRQFEAFVAAVDPRVNRTARAIQVQAIADNKDGALRPGQFVSVTVRMDERRGSTFVPEQAVIPQGGNYLVVKVVDGKAAPAPVTIGMRIAAHVEVLSGVAPGDKVVTAGHQKLRPGMPVAPAPPSFVSIAPPDEEIEIENNG